MQMLGALSGFLQVAKGWALGSVLAALVGKTSEGDENGDVSGHLAQQLQGLSVTWRDHEVAILHLEREMKELSPHVADDDDGDLLSGLKKISRVCSCGWT